MIKLELSIEEVNNILRALGKAPFEEVAGLVGKIKQQGEAQVAEMQKAAAIEQQPEAA